MKGIFERENIGTAEPQRPQCLVALGFDFPHPDSTEEVGLWNRELLDTLGEERALTCICPQLSGMEPSKQRLKIMKKYEKKKCWNTLFKKNI